MSVAHPRLGLTAKLALVIVTWREYARVRARIHRTPLPDLVDWLETRPHRVRLPALDPARLGRLVARILNRGPLRPRCLTLSLVFLRLLARQGTVAELVVGLPPEPTSHEAHAWVEVASRVVGPPPGRLGHEEIARYGAGIEPSPGSSA